MRYWLLTSTTYGTWLPGDARGSVTSVRDRRPDDPETTARLEHATVGQPWEPPRVGLDRSAEAQLKRPPILLTAAHARVVANQFQETARFRNLNLLAVAVMANHFHLVVGVSDDPEPQKMLTDFKAYASRALNREFGKPASGTWWTSGGSKRKLPDDAAVFNAIRYVLEKQPNPLVVWSPDDAQEHSAGEPEA